MQAIQFFDYKILQESLHKLQQVEISNLPCEHADVIIQHETKLKEIYNNYHTALNEVSVIIRQFEEHKRAIRRLIIHHKQCRRPAKKKDTGRVFV